MKICQFLHFPIEGAGAGIFAKGLTQSLIQRDHKVIVLCSEHYPPTPMEQFPVMAVLFSNGENKTFDLDFDFPVFNSHPLSKGNRFGELSKSQRAAYIHVFHKNIKKALFQFNPDIIHVHHGWIIASIVERYNIPYVISLHGTEYYAFRKFKDYQELTLRGIHGAETILAPTEEERKLAISTYGTSPQKVVVVKQGVNTKKFRPVEIEKSNVLEHYSITDANKPVVLFGGRLTAQKGIDVLIRAAKIYSQNNEGPITIIAGAGDDKKRLEKLVKELKLNSIYFIGKQSHQQMVTLYNVADIVVVPSMFEPSGLVAMEALACGTPVIASNVGGLRQTVNKKVGCLIDPGNYTSAPSQLD